MLFPPVAKTDISTYTWKHGNLLIRRSKGGITQNRKTVSEYTGFYSTKSVKGILWGQQILSDVTGCLNTQVSNCTSSTLLP